MRSLSKNVLISLALLILVSAIYRVFPNRPFGFAPQWAMAIFSGAVFIHNKKWAFALPILSMFLSDMLYELLYVNGLSTIQGFYKGQLVNYLLFTGLTAIGFLIKKIRVFPVFGASLAAPTVYFIFSNFIVWLKGAGLQRPKTWEGLLQCYTDAVPFYQNALLSTLVFSTVLFGSYVLVRQYWLKKDAQIA